MKKFRPKMLAGVLALGLATVAPTAGFASAAGAGTPPCQLFADAPFRDGGWLDVRGTPLTDAVKVTEKFRRLNYGSLEIEITIDDPKAYTKPWTVKVNQQVMLNTDLIEFICEERDATHYVGAETKQ